MKKKLVNTLCMSCICTKQNKSIFQPALLLLLQITLLLLVETKIVTTILVTQTNTMHVFCDTSMHVHICCMCINTRQGSSSFSST